MMYRYCFSPKNHVTFQITLCYSVYIVFSAVRCLGGPSFSFQTEYLILSISFLIYFWIVYIWSKHHSLDKRIWSTTNFLPLKESLTLFQIWIFLLHLTYFSPIRAMEYRVTKINSKYFNGTLGPFHLTWLINFIFICSSA